MAMQKYYDIHNHLFNKDFLTKELLYRLIKELKKLLDIGADRDRGMLEVVHQLKGWIDILKRYTYAVKVFCMNDSSSIYEEMNKTYKGEFILTPLTFDLTYCFAESPDRDGLKLKTVIDAEMNSLFNGVEKSISSYLRTQDKRSEIEEIRLWKEYYLEKENFLNQTKELLKQDDQNKIRQSQTRGILDIFNAFDGFDEQIKQITELKNHPDLKGQIFPFLAVDPRRPKIVEYAKANIGKGKPFIGIKLYTPNGYSPTDPLLYGAESKKGGMYEFCEKNGIPITVHNSDGGFATLAHQVKINGDIYLNGKLVKANNAMVKFKYSIFEKGAINERAKTLNHPLLWEKVVQKYPGLIINLAHFGGGKQLEKALENLNDKSLWSNKIIELITDQRYNVFTDLSCYTNFDTIDKLINSPVLNKIKSRILYGSDFILLLLFENDFNENVNRFKDFFGDDFNIIAGTNPQKFLQHVI
jgi:predicted TIM-barrel fold metal-dependent hydrolase